MDEMLNETQETQKEVVEINVETQQQSSNSVVDETVPEVIAEKVKPDSLSDRTVSSKGKEKKQVVNDNYKEKKEQKPVVADVSTNKQSTDSEYESVNISLNSYLKVKVEKHEKISGIMLMRVEDIIEALFANKNCDITFSSQKHAKELISIISKLSRTKNYTNISSKIKDYAIFAIRRSNNLL